jgi:S-adenosylmethionine:tRNA ribosyltransferase-isomerase
MKTSDFYYDLPKDLIAQTPLTKRDNSRLMILDKNSGEIIHKKFYNIVDMLNKGDTLILNDSKVLPARLYGKREDTGANIEFLLLNNKGDSIWEVLVKPGKKAKEGAKIIFADGKLEAEVTFVQEDGNRLVKFKHEGDIYSILEEIGEMPLPHYITEHLGDKDRYQTVYCNELGSAAAPTAGLHFTKELINRIKDKGVNIGYVTLHVGLGTFRPVKVNNLTDHKMHSEHYYLSQQTADLINNTKKNGKRVIAVGTTSCRTLESAADKSGFLKEKSGWTDIFIYPGYKFCAIDALITNFHLPESTLIMLVSALAGKENIKKAYEIAVKEQYRFFSFGDAMFIK